MSIAPLAGNQSTKITSTIPDLSRLTLNSRRSNPIDVKAELKVLPHQLQFANNVTDKYLAIVGGFGSGKSEADVYRAMKLLKHRDRAVICMIAPTNGMIEDINLPDFQDIFSRYNINHRTVGGQGQRKIIVRSGQLQGEVWFRSGDRPENIVGFEATDILLDEFDIIKPAKQKILWRKCLGRLRSGEGTTIALSTTPEGFRYTYELFHKRKIGPLIRARTTDNPFLPADYIQSLYDQYDAVLVEQYINAMFVNINGLAAYYSFDRDRHHKSVSPSVINRYPWIGIGWDFNLHKMCCELFIYNKRKKRFHVFDEIIIRGNANTEKMCKKILAKYPNHRFRAFPDSSGKSGSTNASKSDLEIIASHPEFSLYYHPKNPFVRDRLASMNSIMSHDVFSIDTIACPDLTEDLEQVVRDKSGDLDKSDDERTHSSDAIGYPAAFLFEVTTARAGVIARG